jgi:hypothetical protein
MFKLCFQRVKVVVLLALCSISLLSCGKGQSQIPGLENVHIGVLQSRLYASFVSTSLNWDEGVTLPIPGLDDATVSVAPDLNSDGTVFQFSIALSSLTHKAKFYPSSGLPDGQPLPDVRDGVLPRWDVDVKKLKLSLYLSDDAFALFVPLDFISRKGITLPVTVSMTIEDERGNVLGKAYAIASGPSGKGSGALILLPFLGSAPQP